MSHDPNQHHDDLDRLLGDAFATRHVPMVDRPSVLDVQRRARRRTQRRSAAMVGCTAVVALGGAGLWAARQSGNGEDTSTAGDGGAPDATYCLPVVPTTMVIVNTTAPPPYTGPAPMPPVFDTLPPPYTGPGTTAFGTLPPSPTSTLSPSTVLEAGASTVPAGDQAIGATTTVTVDQAVIVPGAAATLPPAGSTTTMPPGAAVGQDCYPVLPSEWHCTGPLGTDEFGRDVYEYCENTSDGMVTTIVFPPETTSTAEIIPTTTSIEPFVCPPNASCAIEPQATSTIAIVGTTDQP